MKNEVGVIGSASIKGTVRGYDFEAVWAIEVVDGKQHSGFDEFWVEGVDDDDLNGELMEDIYEAMMNRYK